MKKQIKYIFEVGDWIIGPPINVPTRVMEIITTPEEDSFIGMFPNGETGEFVFTKEDKLCCPIRVARELQLTVLDRMTEEQYERICTLTGREPEFHYCPETDTIYMNGLVVYTCGKFKDINQL